MAILKQGATYSRKFLMVLSSDSKTGATGKTVTVMLSKGAGAAGTTAAGAVTELDSTNLPGMYQVALTNTDTAVLGDLGFECTASLCDHTTFIDQVQTHVFADLNVDASGNVSIASSYKKNQAAVLPFLMTSGNPPLAAPGLAVTAQRSLAGAGFAPCANSPTEIGNGAYTINLAASDTNASVIFFRFTSALANDQDITLYTQP